MKNKTIRIEIDLPKSKLPELKKRIQPMCLSMNEVEFDDGSSSEKFYDLTPLEKQTLLDYFGKIPEEDALHDILPPIRFFKGRVPEEHEEAFLRYGRKCMSGEHKKFT